jgi:hypothetical protein
MAIDSYAPCPGGTGKKIKFCCSELVGDLEQLDRLVEGDQISAALDQVKRLAEKHPGKACLLATQTKLELASKQFTEAAGTARRFLDAHPDNPLALGQSAVTEAVAGRVQEAAALFDKAREAAGKTPEGGTPPLQELARIAATLVQAAAQTGHVGFAQGIVDWLVDSGAGSADELRLLAAIVGSSGVPVSLRSRIPLEEAAGDAAWRPDFDTALAHARAWRLSKALTAFRSLKSVAGDSRPLLTNIGILCEMLARPIEASEAWLAVSRLAGMTADDAVEAVGRAIALETEADPDRSPQIPFTSLSAPLSVPTGEEGTRALELLEDTLRHEPRFEATGFDRSAWVSRNAVPPRSVWRIYQAAAGDALPRLLASLLIFGRQTDKEPEAVLQGFGADVAAAQPAVESLAGCRVEKAADVAGMPVIPPTTWLLGAQFRLPVPTTPPAPPAAGELSPFDVLVQKQALAVRDRFVETWPDTPLPELLGKTPRQAIADVEGRRRVEALISEGEATSRRADLAEGWTAVRSRLGLPAPAAIAAEQPLEDVPPLRWHRIDMAKLPLEQLRGLLVTAMDAGFERATERAAEALAARSDATPEDRWEALGALEERAATSLRKLELIAELRGIAKQLNASEGMLDVADLRVRLQRGDQAEIVRLLDRLRRDHSRDRRVIQALAEVLAEAGIDLSSLAAAGAAGPAGAAAAMPAAAAPEAGKLWTPGGAEPAGPSGEKKVIWTP